MMMRRLISCMFALAMAIAAGAQAVPFVTIQPSAERLAAGGAHVATADNYPLSGSAFEAGVGKTYWQTGAIDYNLTNIEARVKLTPKLTAGLLVTTNSMAEMTLYSESGQPLGTSQPTELCAGIGLSFNPARQLVVNITGKYIRSALTDTYEASCLAADLGAIWRFDGPFAAGICIENIGEGIDYGYGKYPLPTTVKCGGYALFGDIHAAELAADFGAMPAYNTLLTSVSAGYVYNKMIAVRCGAHISTKGDIMPTYASFGAAFTGTNFDIAAAYLTAANTYSVSLRLKL